MSSGISSHASIKNISQQFLNLGPSSVGNRVAIADKQLLPVKITFTSLSEHPLFQKTPRHDADLNVREVRMIDLGTSISERQQQASVQEEPIYDIPKNNQAVNKAVVDENTHYQVPKNNQSVDSEKVANEAMYQEIQEEAIYEEIPYNLFSNSSRATTSLAADVDSVVVNHSDMLQPNEKSLKNKFKNKLQSLEIYYEMLVSIKNKIKAKAKVYFGVGIQQASLLAHRQAVMDGHLKIDSGIPADPRGELLDELRAHIIPSMGVKNIAVPEGDVKIESGAKYEERIRTVQSRPLPPLPEPFSQSEVDLYNIQFNGPVFKTSEQLYDSPATVLQEPIYDVPKSLDE